MSSDCMEDLWRNDWVGYARERKVQSAERIHEKEPRSKRDGGKPAYCAEYRFVRGSLSCVRSALCTDSELRLHIRHHHRAVEQDVVAPLVFGDSAGDAEMHIRRSADNG